MRIPFNKPFLTGKETHYIYEAVASGKISGNGRYTKLVHEFFAVRYGLRKSLLTTSCTDALEMAALLLEIVPGDEVIVPSYTFVSTANAFVLRGATIRFADSYPDHPNVDPANIEALLTERTKAIVVVHYAGVACDMDPILEIAARHDVRVVEDAAQAIASAYKGRPLGGIGALGAYSFHETKNVISGEGGLLAVNDPAFAERAEVIWEKGTNRAAFFRGEVDKYNWVDIGSSYLPSEIVAAFLYAQLENLEAIQGKRLLLYDRYLAGFRASRLTEAGIGLPYIPAYATHNAHMFYLVCRSGGQRRRLITHLEASGLHAVFHYLSLHKSPFYASRHDGRALPNCDRFADCLVRLPFFYDLEVEEVDEIVEAVVRGLRAF